VSRHSKIAFVSRRIHAVERYDATLDGTGKSYDIKWYLRGNFALIPNFYNVENAKDGAMTSSLNSNTHSILLLGLSGNPASIMSFSR
jgi:hypothetical protein